ncbi:MAG: hypothetical protein ACXVLQ_05075 [Bacteriovorax sp.]
MKMTMATMTILMALASTTVFGADKAKAPAKKKMVEMTQEQRQNMASAHEKMATCLRSDKPVEECRKEMMQSCQDTMGKDGCSMMGKMHEMGGMMHGKGMMDQEEKKE